MTTEHKINAESAIAIGSHALVAIGTMTQAILQELDRGAGKLDAQLIVQLLLEIDYRAEDAQGALHTIAARVGLEDPAGSLVFLDRAAALEGRTSS